MRLSSTTWPARLKIISFLYREEVVNERRVVWCVCVLFYHNNNYGHYGLIILYPFVLLD